MCAGAFTSAQVHRNARVRPGIGNGVRAAAAVQGVRAGSAVQPVITVAALQGVRAGITPESVIGIITGQRVRVRAADNALKPPDTVTCRVPAGGFTSAQVHRNARVRPGIGDRILAVATVQGVCAGTTIQPVIAGVARDGVAVVITGQCVRVRTAGNVLETPDTIPRCVPAGDLIGTQVHRDALDRPFIGNGILAAATVQGIGAGAAVQSVITVTAVQGVRAVAASQPVIAGAALQPVVFRDVIHVSRSVQPVITVTAVQDVRAVAASQPVITVTAVQGVCAIAALQPVIAGAAVQGVRAIEARDAVVAVITAQHIRVVTADNVLKPPDAVSFRMPAGGFTGEQVHGNALIV